MKALMLAFMLLLIGPASTGDAFANEEIGLARIHMEKMARQLLLNSTEAEIEFSYEQRQSLYRNIVLDGQVLQRKLQGIYRYRIIFRKSADGRLHYQVESQTSLNGKLKKREQRNV